MHLTLRELAADNRHRELEVCKRQNYNPQDCTATPRRGTLTLRLRHSPTPAHAETNFFILTYRLLQPKPEKNKASLQRGRPPTLSKTAIKDDALAEFVARAAKVLLLNKGRMDSNLFGQQVHFHLPVNSHIHDTTAMPHTTEKP
jgi:hypothetical protein